MTKIKICGMVCSDDIDCVNRNRVDFAGFVMFFPKSKRNVSPEQAVELMSGLSSEIKRVAVVVSPTLEQANAIKRCGFDYMQVHGVLEQQVAEKAEIPILRAFNVSNMGEYPLARAAGYVFDAAQPGSGSTFDWNLLKSIPKSDGKIMLLAGGLNPQNISKALSEVRPHGVDVSSGVEYSDGGKIGKDPAKVAEFVRLVREFDRSIPQC